MDLLGQLGLATVVFVSTNFDDLFLLAALFADPRLRARNIVAGQYLGVGVLVVVSAAAGLAALTIPEGWTALLGIAPLFLGLRGLPDVFRRAEPEESEEPNLPLTGWRRSAQLLSVASVTIANGGDNLGVYVPLFASEPQSIPLYAAVFAVLIAVWCAAGYLLINNPWIGNPIRRYGHRALPLVLIALGLYILSGALVLFS